MPQRKEAEPLTKVTLNLYSRDVERMKEIYPHVKYQVATRSLVRAHVARHDKRIGEAGEELADEIILDDDAE